MGRLAKIRRLFRRRVERDNHPFRAVFKWAKTKWPKVSVRRFRSLQKWARKERNRAKGAARKAWELRRKRYRRKKRFYQRQAEPEPDGDGLTIFDGKSVPTWIASIAAEVRATGEWWGVVISGSRTPEHSEALCFAICGAPKCPGECAGVDSNHNVTIPVSDGEGAIDVSDHVGFARGLAKIGKSHLLKNTIGPSDPNHFSRSGQ